MSDIREVQRRFDVLYSTLCDVQGSLIDNMARTAGFLLLAAGWIATSETTRSFLRANPSIRYLAVVSLAGAFGLYGAASIKAFLISRDTFRLLVDLDFMPEA
jgi:hypothetical protein